MPMGSNDWDANGGGGGNDWGSGSTTNWGPEGGKNNKNYYSNSPSKSNGNSPSKGNRKGKNGGGKGPSNKNNSYKNNNSHNNSDWSSSNNDWSQSQNDWSNSSSNDWDYGSSNDWGESSNDWSNQNDSNNSGGGWGGHSYDNINSSDWNKSKSNTKNNSKSNKSKGKSGNSNSNYGKKNHSNDYSQSKNDWNSWSHDDWSTGGGNWDENNDWNQWNSASGDYDKDNNDWNNSEWNNIGNSKSDSDNAVTFKSKWERENEGGELEDKPMKIFEEDYYVDISESAVKDSENNDDSEEGGGENNNKSSDTRLISNSSGVNEITAYRSEIAKENNKYIDMSENAEEMVKCFSIASLKEKKEENVQIRWGIRTVPADKSDTGTESTPTLPKLEWKMHSDLKLNNFKDLQAIPQYIRDNMVNYHGWEIPMKCQKYAIPPALGLKGDVNNDVDEANNVNESVSWKNPKSIIPYDVIGLASTGSGKTIAFLVPLIVYLNRNPGMNSLVLAPTRELGDQTYKVFEKMCHYQIAAVSALGGLPKQAQLSRLPEARLVVGTVGRVYDFCVKDPSSNHTPDYDLSKVGFFVLDEADKLLDPWSGFDSYCMEMADLMPKERITMLFTATWPDRVQNAARKICLNDICLVEVDQKYRESESEKKVTSKSDSTNAGENDRGDDTEDSEETKVTDPFAEISRAQDLLTDAKLTVRASIEQKVYVYDDYHSEDKGVYYKQEMKKKEDLRTYLENLLGIESLGDRALGIQDAADAGSPETTNTTPAERIDIPKEYKILIFVAKKTFAEDLCQSLWDAGFQEVDRIHGGIKQEKRMRALQSFKDGYTRLLVATEVIGRGVDIPEVSHVIIFDFTDTESYVHRVGRTARGVDGKGSAVVFFEWYNKLPYNAAHLIKLMEEAGQGDNVPEKLRLIANEVQDGTRKIPNGVGGNPVSFDSFNSAVTNGYGGGNVKKNNNNSSSESSDWNANSKDNSDWNSNDWKSSGGNNDWNTGSGSNDWSSSSNGDWNKSGGGWGDKKKSW